MTADLASGPVVRWLGQGTLPNVEAVGGKARSLHRLAALGHPTPGGFCLTVAALDAHLRGNGNDEKRDELQSRLPEEDARHALVALVADSALLDDVAHELREAVAALRRDSSEHELFAVRSSGTSEDSDEASYAGQHETVLGVSERGVAAAVQACWTSLWSESAVGYRVQRGLGFDDLRMGVVVQPAVAAEASAVVFSGNPVTGATDEVFVSTVPGLGSALVSGAVTPATYVLTRDRSIVEATPGDITERIVLDANGGTRIEPLPSGEDGRLGEAEVCNLVRRVFDVEAEYGTAVDVEAAYERGGWVLLQARPVTTGE